MKLTERAKVAAICMLLGSALVLIGTLLPWITVSTGFGALSRSGLDFSDDAKIILVLGLVCGVAALARLAGVAARGFIGPTTSILGVVAAATSIYDYTLVNDRVNGVSAATVGSGIYLCIVGAVLMTAGAGILWGVDETKPEVSEPSPTVAP